MSDGVRRAGPRPARARAGAALLLGVALLPLTGCETTQDLSARIGKQLQDQPVAGTELVRIGRATPGVRLGRPLLLRSKDGAAVVVEVRNGGSRGLTGLPIGVRVSDGGESIYSNRIAGLDRELLRFAFLRPGERAYWVNDHLPVLKSSARVKANPGSARRVAAGRAPRITVGGLRLGSDGGQQTVEGQIRNGGSIVQRELVVFVVAERGGRPVAAGTAKVAALKARGRTSFVAFLIGDAHGARLRAVAPPTALEK
jgi:hypothetical protein